MTKNEFMEIVNEEELKNYNLITQKRPSVPSVDPMQEITALLVTSQLPVLNSPHSAQVLFLLRSTPPVFLTTHFILTVFVSLTELRLALTTQSGYR